MWINESLCKHKYIWKYINIYGNIKCFFSLRKILLIRVYFIFIDNMYLKIEYFSDFMIILIIKLEQFGVFKTYINSENKINLKYYCFRILISDKCHIFICIFVWKKLWINVLIFMKKYYSILILLLFWKNPSVFSSICYS